MRNDKRGSTLECWKDYASRLPQGTKNCEVQREGLRTFIGVQAATIRCYITAPKSLRGLPLVKMRYFLKAQGYEVLELEALRSEVEKFGELVAYGLMTIQEAVEVLNYTDQHGVFRVLHGELSQLPNARIISIRGCLERHKNNLQKAKSEWSAIWGVQYVAPIAPLLTQPKVEPVHTNSNMRDDIVIFSGLVRALLPVVMRLSSDSCSAENRKIARSEAGSQNVFDLSTGLNRLCSETARNQYKGVDPFTPPARRDS